MRMSQYWQGVLDHHKQHSAESKFLESKALYGRMEMLARAEIEIAEAIEKVEAKS